MDPDLWKQVDALFEQALDQAPDKRQSFVAEACKGNAALRDEVLSLIEAQSRAVEFMDGLLKRLAR